MPKSSENGFGNQPCSGVFVSWSPHLGRTQGFIQALDLCPLYVNYFERKLYTAPFRYMVNFISTLSALRKLKPEFVFVLNPPVFASAAVDLYCQRRGVKYIIDSHSGAFENSKWKWSLGLQKWLARRAQAVLVTNPVHEALVNSWGATPVVVGDPPPVIPPIKPVEELALDFQQDRLNIVVVSSYGREEAFEEVVEAARQHPEVTFWVTGDKRKADPGVVANLPANVNLTGWLALDDYWALLQHVDAVLTLTTQENTILRGSWEAMYLGNCLITSNTSALRNYYQDGAVYVENTSSGISAGIQDCLSNRQKYRLAILKIQQEKLLSWQQKRKEIGNLVGRQW